MGGETGACLLLLEDGSLLVVADDDLRRDRGCCWEETGADRRRSLRVDYCE